MFVVVECVCASSVIRIIMAGRIITVSITVDIILVDVLHVGTLAKLHFALLVGYFRVATIASAAGVNITRVAI